MRQQRPVGKKARLRESEQLMFWVWRLTKHVHSTQTWSAHGVCGASISRIVNMVLGDTVCLGTWTFGSFGSVVQSLPLRRPDSGSPYSLIAAAVFACSAAGRTMDIIWCEAR